MNLLSIRMFAILTAVLPFLFQVAAAQPSPNATADKTLRQYLELRLRGEGWDKYSRHITWPDEPGWDCWWVAKTYSIGRSTGNTKHRTIPVTFQRLGKYCVDGSFEHRRNSETIRFDMIHMNGVWKVNGPDPDYPYLSVTKVRQLLKKVSTDTQETEERRKQARASSEALEKALAK